MSAPYKINGVSIAPPEKAHWVERKNLGIDGNGLAVYPPVREFEMQWGFLWVDEFTVLQGFFDSQISGSLIVDLPKYGDSGWNFISYTGCYLQEPHYDSFFEKSHSNVILLITNIRTY